MAKTIYTLVHPFYREGTGHRRDSFAEDNVALYSDILDTVVADPESFLFYISSIEDPNSWFKHHEEYEGDTELQQYLGGLPPEAQDRIAILTDFTGDQAKETLLYKPDFSVLEADNEDVQDTALQWFAHNETATLYDRGLSKFYVDVTDASDEQRHDMLATHEGEPRKGASLYVENERTYLTMPLHPQIAKTARFLGLQDDEIRINNDSTMTIPREVRQSTRIAGAGEYLDACVFQESIGLSVALGIPVRNISLNEGQPHLVLEKELDMTRLRRPIDSLFPRTMTSELARPGFRR